MKLTPNFSAKATVKKLLREGRTGALATLMPGTGDPYCSLVNVATAADSSPLLLISKLALHTKNILADPRVSLMLDERKEGDPLEGGRVMLMGTAVATDDPDARRRYLERQPEAQMFADFADFGFYKLTLKGAHLVAGFGRDQILAFGETSRRNIGRVRHILVAIIGAFVIVRHFDDAVADRLHAAVRCFHQHAAADDGFRRRGRFRDFDERFHRQLAEISGGLFDFGAAIFAGSQAGQHLNAPVIAVASVEQ